jgi:hypothetical protein
VEISQFADVKRRRESSLGAEVACPTSWKDQREAGYVPSVPALHCPVSPGFPSPHEHTSGAEVRVLFWCYTARLNVVPFPVVIVPSAAARCRRQHRQQRVPHRALGPVRNDKRGEGGGGGAREPSRKHEQPASDCVGRRLPPDRSLNNSRTLSRALRHSRSSRTWRVRTWLFQYAEPDSG